MPILPEPSDNLKLTIPTKKLTIGMACHDDYNGVYFSIIAIRSNLTEEQRKWVDFVVIDNNPTSPHGEKTKLSCTDMGPSVKYVPCTDKISTSIRDQVFLHGAGEWVLCIDCHVVVPCWTINHILSFISDPARTSSKDLYHGPMVTDCGASLSTHMDMVWREGFYGTWQYDTEKMKGTEPFEIPSHGMAFFLCRRDAWLGFCPEFREFGGEEGYIHKKFRLFGAKVWCVPQFAWYHRFHRVEHNYPRSVGGKIKNYIRAAIDLGEDPATIMEAFKQYHPHELVNYRNTVLVEMALRKPAISVITKFHFRTECLPEALESFLRQTLKNSQMVIVNNNPKTKVVFEHPRVKIINMETEPESIYQVVEAGLRAADADWVTFLDDDDLAMPNYLASYLPYLNGPFDRVIHERHGQSGLSKFGQIANHGVSNIHAVRRDFLLDSAITRPEKRGAEWVAFDQDMVKGARLAHLIPRDDQIHIYRWGGVRRHMSAQTRVWSEMRAQMNAIPVPEVVNLVPGYSQDWEAAVLGHAPAVVAPEA